MEIDVRRADIELVLLPPARLEVRNRDTKPALHGRVSATRSRKGTVRAAAIETIHAHTRSASQNGACTARGPNVKRVRPFEPTWTELGAGGSPTAAMALRLSPAD